MRRLTPFFGARLVASVIFTFLFSSFVSAQIINLMRAPASLGVNAYSNMHELGWPAICEATSYTIEQSYNSGAYSVLYNGPGNGGDGSALAVVEMTAGPSIQKAGTCTDTGAFLNFTRSLSNVGSYRYRIKACAGLACSAFTYSSTVNFGGLPPKKPSAISSVMAAPGVSVNGSYSLSWGVVSGATSYQISEQKNNGNWTTFASQSATTKNYAGKADGVYRYLVKACNSSGCSVETLSNDVYVGQMPSFSQLGGSQPNAPFSDTTPLAPKYTGVRTMAGSGSVSGGSAAYSIPIQLPPGRNGM